MRQLPPPSTFREVSGKELRESFSDLNNVWLIYERPLKEHAYVISADVSDGLGSDYDASSIDVLRQGTVERIEEQVAHFRTNVFTPSELAYVIEGIGRYFCDREGFEALVAIENNNHGLSCQDTLHLHLGYSHFYRWEVFDSGDPAKRFTRKIGWQTTKATRPIILDHLYHALTRLDPISGKPDLLINSPHTWGELADFQTDGALWEAAATKGAHDDCLMSLAIGHYVSWRLQGGEREPVAEIRRRRHEIDRQLELHAGESVRPDWRNLPFSSDEMDGHVEYDEALFDVRGSE